MTPAFTLSTFDGYECLPLRLPPLTEAQARRVLAHGRREAERYGWQVDGDGDAFTARRGRECVQVAIVEASSAREWAYEEWSA